MLSLTEFRFIELYVRLITQHNTRVDCLLLTDFCANDTTVLFSGLVWIGQGRTENLTNLFDNTSDSPGNYALAFYAVSLYELKLAIVHSSRLHDGVLFAIYVDGVK